MIIVCRHHHNYYIRKYNRWLQMARKLLLQDRLVQDPVNALQEILDHFQARVHTIRSLFFGTGQSWTWAFGLIWRSCSFWLSCGLSSIWLSLVNIGASTSIASHRFPIWWPFWGRGHSSSFFFNRESRPMLMADGCVFQSNWHFLGTNFWTNL